MAFAARLDDVLAKLGVGYTLGPYQTAPWSCYDPDKDVTCSAEVRMGMDGDELEAEAQMMYDIPPAGKPPMEQICYIRLKPASDGQWGVSLLRVRGAPYGDGIQNWEEKCCNFFALLLQKLKLNEIPDIDELIEEAFGGKDRLADQTGGGGKAPKVRMNKVLGMKKGGSGF